MTANQCPECGAAVSGRSDKRFCSERCQRRQANRRWRETHREEERERARARREADPEHAREVHRSWRERNREHLRSYYRRRVEAKPNIHVLYQHGLHPDELHELYLIQDGRCAICDAVGLERGDGCLFIDHDHGTGERRGLICHECNKALPVLERVGPSWALRALAYLSDPPLPRMRRRRKEA